jgi:hypothetical protein
MLRAVTSLLVLHVAYPWYKIKISEFILTEIFRILKYTEFLKTSHVTTVQKVLKFIKFKHIVTSLHRYITFFNCIETNKESKKIFYISI